MARGSYRTFSYAGLLAAITLGLGVPAHGNVLWNWSFSSQSGTFLTDGSAPGGIAAPGVYHYIDMAVTQTTSIEVLGSVSGGQYNDTGISTNQPYSFQWNGNQVTEWDDGGPNLFNWWVFPENPLAVQIYVIFGLAPVNVNNPNTASIYNGFYPATGPVTVSVASPTTPEPSTALLFLGGFVGLGAVLRKRLVARL